MQKLIDRFVEEQAALDPTIITRIEIRHPGHDTAGILIAINPSTETEIHRTIERLMSILRPMDHGYRSIGIRVTFGWKTAITSELHIMLYKTDDEIVERWYFRPNASKTRTITHRFLGPAEQTTALSKNKKTRQQWYLYGKPVPAFQSLLGDANAFSQYLEKNPKKGLFVAKTLMQAGLLQLSPEIAENIHALEVLIARS